MNKQVSIKSVVVKAKLYYRVYVTDLDSDTPTKPLYHVDMGTMMKALAAQKLIAARIARDKQQPKAA